MYAVFWLIPMICWISDS